MILRSLLLGSSLLIYSVGGFAKTNPTNAVTIGSGVATDSEPGLVYVEGFEHKIVQVQTETGVIRVLAPSMGAATVSVGEKIIFSGRLDKIGVLDVVNTRAGYIYRQSAKTMQDQIMEQMAQAQQQMASSLPNSAYNAVPITMLETDEQKRENERREVEAKQESRLNLVLAALGLLLALLSFEKIPRLMHALLVPVKFIANRVKKHSASEPGPP